VINIGGDWTNAANLGKKEVVSYTSDTIVVVESLTTESTISNVTVESVGKSYTITSTDSNYNRVYVLIDDTASTAPNAVLTDTLTEPDEDHAKMGRYNGDDRCIGVAISASGGTTLNTGDVVEESSNVLEYAYYGETDNPFPVLAVSQNPDGNWQSPNTNESSDVLPINAIAVFIYMGNTDTTSVIRLLAASKERSADYSPGVGDFRVSGYDEVADTAYVTLGKSRDIRIRGTDTNDNALRCAVIKFKIKI
ncbi:MAG: hypothetical protein ACYS1A_18910, partial [Planctomycetota bacterium]